MTAAVVVVALLALLFLVLSIARLRRRRLAAAGGHGVLGCLLLVAAVALGAVALNLHTYQRLTYERPAAELAFKRLAPERYRVELHYPSGKRRTFELDGDEWQLDARMLKWRGLANLLGLDAQFRLERLSGRYRDIGRERRGPKSVHEITPSSGLDLWALAQRHGGWLPWVDAVYGSATYLPMADQASYSVRVTQNGLVARPLDVDAKKAVRHWQ